MRSTVCVTVVSVEQRNDSRDMLCQWWDAGEGQRIGGNARVDSEDRDRELIVRLLK